MPWKPLPDDIPLDHEALTPPPVVDSVSDAVADPVADPPPATDASALTELPADAQLDRESEPEPPQPIIIVGHRKPEIQSQQIDPTYTEQGFADQIEPEKTYHTALTKEDKAEYASFFQDPKNPPSAAKLQLWYHQKTGALFGNAQQVVDTFKKTGKFSTIEKITVPSKAEGAADSFNKHIGNSFLGDFGAEVTAPLGALGLGSEDRPDVWNSDASFSQLTAQNADLTREQLDRDSADHPIASAVGELGGIVAAAPVGGAVADVARVGKLGEVGANVAKAAAGGGIYGAGAAGPGHRLEGAAVGAVAAPVVSTLAKVPVAGYRAAGSVFQRSPNLARKIIAKAIKDDANTPESVGTDIATANANDVPMALGDTGENVRGLMAASSRSSGMGRTIVRDALETRQAELADRITRHIERDLGPVANPHQVADDLLTKARTDAAPLYDSAYAKPGAGAFVEKVRPLLSRPSMKKALSNAYRIAQEEGENPETLGLSKFKPSDSPILDASGKPMQVDEVQVTTAPTWKTLDYVKRGMDDVVEGYRDSVTGKLNLDTEGRATNNTLRSFISAFDKANPDYAAARAAYAGPVKGVDAMNQGRKALSMTADDLEARMRDMTPFEKKMFAAGTRRAMAELVQSKGDTADVVHALVGTGKKRAMLARLFGDRKQFQRFADTLGQEREGWRSFRQALLGSPTAGNLADDTTLEAATTAAELVAHGGIPVTTAIRKTIKLLGREVGEKTKQQIAALLSNTDPAAIRELAAQLRDAAVKRGIRARRINAATNAIGKSAVVLEAQQAQ